MGDDNPQRPRPDALSSSFCSSRQTFCSPVLSRDVLRHIFSQLDCVYLLRGSSVCKQWYIESAELREGWKDEYLEACFIRGLNVKRGSNRPLARLDAYLAGCPD